MKKKRMVKTKAMLTRRSGRRRRERKVKRKRNQSCKTIARQSYPRTIRDSSERLLNKNRKAAED